MLIPIGIWLFRKWVPAVIYARNLAFAEAASNHPVSKVAAVVIVTLWIGAAVWLGWITDLI